MLDDYRYELKKSQPLLFGSVKMHYKKKHCFGLLCCLLFNNMVENGIYVERKYKNRKFPYYFKFRIILWAKERVKCLQQFLCKR